jgi:arylsulfatase A-like enzyme
MYLAVSAPHGFTDDRHPIPEPTYENAPVPDFLPPPSYFESDRSDKPVWNRPPDRRTQEWVQAERAGTYRTLYSVDDLVESVFNELEQTREADNTLAFFLSDNGFLWGEHGEISKGAPYPESARIPLMMRWPDRVPAGSRDARLAGTIDLLPTVLEAAGLDRRPREIDGRSLLDPTWERNRILLEFWSNIPQINPHEPTFASTLAPDYQYTEYYEEDASTPKQWPANEPFGTGPVRTYYDLLQDPFELTNLLHDGDLINDPLVAPLSEQLARDRVCTGHGPLDKVPPPCP